MKVGWIHVAAALALGLATGWALHGFSARGRNGDDPARAAGESAKLGDRDRPGRRPQFGPRAAILREELRRATPEMLPKLVIRTLEDGDPAERMALVLEMFSAVDSSNAEAVMDAFEEITRDSGRTHPEEWRLACFLTGQRAGPTMMARCLRQGLAVNERQARETFFGWASVDPEAAEAWLDGLPGDDIDERAKPPLMKALMAGVALHDPDAAIQRLDELPEPMKLECLGDVSFQIVQGQGLDRAIDWMLEVNGRSANTNTNLQTETEFPSRLREDILGKVFYAGSGRGGGTEVAERLLRINATVPIDGRRVVREAGQMRSIDGLDMVERLSDSPILADPPLREEAIRAAFFQAMRQSRRLTEEWLVHHPDSAVTAAVATAP